MDKNQYLFFQHRRLNKLKIFRNNLHIFVICYVLFRVFLFLIYKLSILYTQTFFMIISSETENVSDSPNKTFFIPDRSAPHRTVPPPKSLKRLFLLCIIYRNHIAQPHVFTAKRGCLYVRDSLFCFIKIFFTSFAFQAFLQNHHYFWSLRIN